MRVRKCLLLFVLLLSALCLPVQARTFESSPEQVSLLELYTSEGCSSCPPAEAWLGGLKNEAGLWKKFVPVAFHVDYWNSLGWPDRFSRPEFTRRQQSYARAWGSGTIYTPEFVLQGREWRRGPGEMPAPAATRPGILRVVVEKDAEVFVSFRAESGENPSLFIYIAPLGGGIVTEVKRGENAGEKLPHEFVALRLQSAPLTSVGNGLYQARLTLPDKTVVPIEALAAWVSAGEDAPPLQAVGGYLR